MNAFAFIANFFRALLRTRGRILNYYLVVRRSRILDVTFYTSQFERADRWWIARVAIFHYLVVGERQAIRPNPLYLKDFYRSACKLPVRDDAFLVHYILKGSLAGLMPNPFFLGHYYVEKYHDVLDSGQHPLAHYYWSGWREGRNPHPQFNTKEYCQKFQLDLAGAVNPLVHFLDTECTVPSELWGLKAGNPVVSGTTPTSTIAGKLTVDLIVPVYRRPDLVERLFEGLLASEDWSRVARCVIVDDCGDSFTTTYLRSLAGRIDKIRLIKNEANLGFLRSCNKAYQETSADIVVLVNSDVQVPDSWLNRLVAPFDLDNKIALSTPLATSGANLSISLRPGQSWVDVDQIVSRDPPKYPDACTAIGYLMAIRRSAISTPLLFDEIFQHGYGEDTDLHYRLISKGLRSVICDNLVVLHKGSASYLLDNQKSKIYDQNRKIFFERWGQIHQRAHDKFVEENALARILTPFAHTKDELVGEDIDILFISPTNKRSIGGVKIIFELASYLCDHGIKAKVLCTEQTELISDHLHDSIMPIFKEETLFRLVKSTRIVVGTGVGVVDFTRHFVDHYNAQMWWLVQGPECYFGVGEYYHRFPGELRASDRVITVSKYLTNLVGDLGGRVDVTLPLGPDPLVFYPRDVKREKKSVAIQLIDTPDKGSRFAISFAEEAKRQGFEPHFFGLSRLYKALPDGLGVRHGQLNTDSLAKLFSQCEYYLDLSFMEGLGLLPLEANMCGCIPVMTRKGAPDLIFKDEAHVIWLDSHLDYRGGIQKIHAAQSVPFSPGSLIEKNNSKSAFKQFLDKVKES